MCDFNGPFRLCTCSSDIDYTNKLATFRNQGIINPLPSQLEEVYTHYLSVIVEGEFLQGE